MDVLKRCSYTITFAMMASFLALFLTNVAVVAASDEHALEAWHEHFPTLSIPQTLRSLVSPLTPSQINRFSTLAKDGTLLQDHALANSFCKAAQATCADVRLMPASSTGTWHGHATSDQKKELLNSPLTTYFHERDLLPGTNMLLNLHNLYPLRPFLPRSIADALPFSSTDLPQMAQAFNVPLNSHGMLLNMHHTLSDCETPEANGEIKRCATSMEAMLDFVTALLGSDVKVMETSTATSGEGEAKAEMLRVVDVPSHRPAKGKSVACHNEMYPYMLYYCHQIHDTKVFQVKLETHDGKPVTGIATCHVNTAKWNPDHIAFQILKAQPGHTDICHFVSVSDLVWVPNI